MRRLGVVTGKEAECIILIAAPSVLGFVKIKFQQYEVERELSSA